MEEFFRELKECLQGEVSEKEIEDSLHYYRQYFAEQKTAGRNEDEILQSLGSPRLIARSIIDAQAAGDSSSDYYDIKQEEYRDFEEEQNHMQIKQVSGWKVVLGIIAVLLVLGMLIRILLPVVFVLVLAVLIWRLIRGGR